MARRITYTDDEQEIILQLTEGLPQRNRGADYKDYSGFRLTEGNAGYVVDIVVGRTIATTNMVVWRAIHEVTGAAILWMDRGSYPRRIRFHYWVQPRVVAIYTMWTSMLQRCYNPSNASYPAYGAKGVRVHPDWLPGGRHTANGTAEERAVAFAAYKDYVVTRWKVKYGINSYPDYDENGDSPEMSRRFDRGNYDKSVEPRTKADHKAEADIAKIVEHSDHIIAREIPGGGLQFRSRLYREVHSGA